MAAGAPYGVADLEMDCFHRGGDVGRDEPVRANLAVGAGPASAASCGSRDGEIGLDVHGIRRRLAPLQADRGQHGQAPRRLHSDRRLHVDDVHVARVPREREIVAVRKQRVERLERAVTGTTIAGGGVHLQAETRRPRGTSEGVTRQAADRPGSHLRRTHIAALAHGFCAPVEAVPGPGIADVADIAPLVTRGVEKPGPLQLVSRIVDGELAGADVFSFDPEAAVLEMAVGKIVKWPVVPVLNRVAPERDDPPGRHLPVDPGRIEGLPHVTSIAGGDEALQVERHLLAPQSRLQLAGAEWMDIGDEALLQVDLVLIDRRDDRLPWCPVVLELGEDLPVFVRVDVGVNLETLQKVALARLPADAEERRLVGLIALAALEAERGGAPGVGRRHQTAFKVADWFRPQPGVCQYRPVLPPTFKLDCRPLWRSLPTGWCGLVGASLHSDRADRQ